MEAVTKNIQIDFVNPTKQAYDAIPDLRKAVENASLNLISRHKVVLGWPMPYNGKVVMEIRIPKEKEDGFSIGNHLRSITTYLMKNCNGRYDDYLVGNRLLIFTEVSDPKEEVTIELSSIDRLESVSKFAKLLQRNDEVAMEKINRILDILKED